MKGINGTLLLTKHFSFNNETHNLIQSNLLPIINRIWYKFCDIQTGPHFMYSYLWKFLERYFEYFFFEYPVQEFVFGFSPKLDHCKITNRSLMPLSHYRWYALRLEVLIGDETASQVTPFVPVVHTTGGVIRGYWR